MRKFYLFIILFGISTQVCAHGFSGGESLQPLIDLDHILAILTIGVWNSQTSKKKRYVVPLGLLALIFLGGLIGVNYLMLQENKFVIAMSIILLSIGIIVNKKISILIASIGIVLFGFSHGLSHGNEISQQTNVVMPLIGFVITTLGLYVIGAVGALLIIEEKEGAKHLSKLGLLILILGILLMAKVLYSYLQEG